MEERCHSMWWRNAAVVKDRVSAAVRGACLYAQSPPRRWGAERIWAPNVEAWQMWKHCSIGFFRSEAVRFWWSERGGQNVTNRAAEP